jgi:hypothetical protein
VTRPGLAWSACAPICASMASARPTAWR